MTGSRAKPCETPGMRTLFYELHEEAQQKPYSAQILGPSAESESNFPSWRFFSSTDQLPCQPLQLMHNLMHEGNVTT